MSHSDEDVLGHRRVAVQAHQRLVGARQRSPRLTIELAPHTLNEFVKRGDVMAGTGQLSAVFSALADPTRRAILDELAERDATVTELSAPLPMSMPAVSRHLKVLEHAALISRTRSGKWRASHLETAPLRDAADWIDRFRRFWDSSLDRLDAHLASVQAAERTDKKEH
jgi:DNA-binding transcriptional ArsR family regulator